MFASACETYGRCPGCGIERLLPGLQPTREAGAGDATYGTWEPVCTDCAGGLGDFTCTRCGREGWRERAGVCGRCVLGDRLNEVLDDGTGQVRLELVPLHAALVGMPRPRAGILWLSKPHVPPILAAIATGQVPLTHAGLSELATRCAPKAVTHVRDLLVDNGVLPPADRFLLLFEQWLPGWLAAIETDAPDPEHARILHRYATWQILRQLRATAEREPVGHCRNQNARSRLRTAAGFLTFLNGLDPTGRTLRDCRQADLDRWLATARSHDHVLLRPFLRWAAASRHAPRLRMPTEVRGTTRQVSAQQRLDAMRRTIDGAAMTSTDRVIVMLILLYAQPLTRIVRLTLDDIQHHQPSHQPDAEPGKTADEGGVFLRLGDPPVPVPPPFDQILLEHAAARSNLMTATNPGSRLLFPGRRAGQPLHPTTIRLRLQALGIPNQDLRNRALRELLLRSPAAVVAGMLGYNTTAAERVAAEAGTGWSRYPAVRHPRAPGAP